MLRGSNAQCCVGVMHNVAWAAELAHGFSLLLKRFLLCVGGVYGVEEWVL